MYIIPLLLGTAAIAVLFLGSGSRTAKFDVPASGTEIPRYTISYPDQSSSAAVTEKAVNEHVPYVPKSGYGPVVSEVQDLVQDAEAFAMKEAQNLDNPDKIFTTQGKIDLSELVEPVHGEELAAQADLLWSLSGVVDVQAPSATPSAAEAAPVEPQMLQPTEMTPGWGFSSEKVSVASDAQLDGAAQLAYPPVIDDCGAVDCKEVADEFKSLPKKVYKKSYK